jgi:DNA-binding LacI/PurR family transcriptional regulator
VLLHLDNNRKMELRMSSRADVAKLAGVSEATVSYVITGKRKISAPVQLRVQAAMDNLGYRPNRMAQALAGGKSRVIALLFPTAARGVAHVDLEYGLGAAQAAQELGYHLVMWPALDRSVEEVIATAKSGFLDGVILMEVALEDTRVQELKAAGITVALIGRTSSSHGDELFADRDFETAADKAMEYIAGLGHKNVAFLTEKTKSKSAVVAALTRTKAAMKSCAKNYGVSIENFECSTEPDDGRKLLDEILEPKPEITAVISLNPGAMVGLLQQANTKKVSVPGRLSLLSMATPESFVSATSPRLTTISPPAFEMGDSAARRLISFLEKTSPENLPSQLWAGELVVRETTGPVTL